jgi:hypothetical protein
MLETLVRHLTMVRLTASASLLAMIGCTGLIDSPPPTKAEIAREKWVETALPALTEATCTVCHGGATPRPMVEFLVGADGLASRQTLLAFEPAVISLDAPQSSRLLTKGQHEGPPLSGNLASNVLDWLQAEKEAANDPTTGGGGGLGLRTQDYAMMICTGGLPGDPTCPINSIDLDNLGEGAGIPGAKISFVAQGVGTGLYLNNLKLIPGPNGAFIEHPLFVSIPEDPMARPIADTFDRFFNTKMNLMMNAPVEQQQIAGGTAAFVNFPPQNKIAIFFKKATPFQPDGGMPPAGGCKVPASFETNARAALNTNCGNCHRGTDQNATSALDMRGIEAPNPNVPNNACNQVKQRMNLQAFDQSGVYVATTPGNNNHPFTFGGNVQAHNAFKAALNLWATAERDAP